MKQFNMNHTKKWLAFDNYKLTVSIIFVIILTLLFFYPDTTDNPPTEPVNTDSVTKVVTTPPTPTWTPTDISTPNPVIILILPFYIGVYPTTAPTITPTSTPPTPQSITVTTPPPSILTTPPPGGKREYDCTSRNRQPLDNTVFKPNKAFDIRWTIVNTGTKSWPAGLDVKYYSGPLMSTTTFVELPAMNPGDTFEVILDAVAPSKRGFHVMTWVVEGKLCFPYVAINVE